MVGGSLQHEKLYQQSRRNIRKADNYCFINKLRTGLQQSYKAFDEHKARMKLCMRLYSHLENIPLTMREGFRWGLEMGQTCILRKMWSRKKKERKTTKRQLILTWFQMSGFACCTTSTPLVKRTDNLLPHIYQNICQSLKYKKLYYFPVFMYEYYKNKIYICIDMHACV